MTAILIIQLLWHGMPIHHVQHIDHGYLSRTVCLDYRDTIRRQWEGRDGVEVIYIDYPDRWAET